MQLVDSWFRHVVHILTGLHRSTRRDAESKVKYFNIPENVKLRFLSAGINELCHLTNLPFFEKHPLGALYQ